MNLAHLTIPELKALHEAYTAAADLYSGVTNQPRCRDVGAGIMMADEADRCSTMATAIINEARTRRASSASDCVALVRLLAGAALEDEDWAGVLHALGNAAEPVRLAA